MITWVLLIGVCAVIGWLIWQPTFDSIPRNANSLGALKIFPVSTIDIFLKFYREAKSKHGRIFYTRFFQHKVIMITDPDDVHTVLVKNKDICLNRWFPSRQANLLIRKGLLATKDDEWYHSRKLIAPLFNWPIMEEMAPVFDEKTKRLLDNIRSTRMGELLEFRSEMSKITADVISKVAFGQNLGLVDGNSAADSISGLIDKFFQFNPLALVPYGFNVPTKTNKELMEATVEIKKIVGDFIKKRREEKLQGKTEEISGKSRRSRDFLQVLFDDNGADAMSDEQLFDECVTMFIAGHETTSTTASWAIYHIAQNPEVEKKIQEELDSVGRPLPDEISLAELKKLPYLAAVVDETLRFHPVALNLLRENSKEISFGEIKIPTNSKMLISVMGIHRDPEFWPNPEKFDPTRFLPENSEKIHPNAYLPFGTGPRICVGQRMALSELKFILGRIFSEFSVKLDPTKEVIEGAFVLHRPNGIYGKLVPRIN